MCGSMLSLRYNSIQRGLRASALDEESCCLALLNAVGKASFLYPTVSTMRGTVTAEELSIISSSFIQGSIGGLVMLVAAPAPCSQVHWRNS